MSNGRLARGEGAGLGGTQIRSRFEKREGRLVGSKLKDSVMAAGHDPNFRNRPEIAGMRQKAADFKETYSPSNESPEAFARRLKRQRG